MTQKTDKSAQRRAQAKYAAQKRLIRPVTFNRETEADLIEASYSMLDFTKWVKEQLKNHIKQNDKGN